MKAHFHTGTIAAMIGFHDPSNALREHLFNMYDFPNPQYESALRYSPYGKPGARIPERLNLTKEDDDGTIWVPRGFDISELPSNLSKEVELTWFSDSRASVKGSFPPPRFTFNTEQQQLIEHFRQLKNDNNAIKYGNVLYTAPTSAGKTVCQAEIARLTGQRTLVLCQTELIKRSWLDDLKACYGIHPGDVGLIQRDKCFIAPHYTIASIMTLGRRREKWAEWNKKFGCVILDEADIVSAPTIYQFLLQSPAKYLIGATATGNVEGKNHFYLPSIFGNPRKELRNYHADTATSMALREVEVIETAFEFPVLHGAQIDWVLLMQCMMEDRKRNALILRHAIQDYKEGESVLVVTRLVAHAKRLHRALLKNGVEDANLILGETNQDRFYTEKLVKGVLNRDVRMVVATMQSVKRGANLNPLSALHMVMPVANKRDIEQLVGRIRRKADNKHRCRFVYYLDSQTNYLYSIFQRAAAPSFRKLCAGFNQTNL